MTELRKPSHIGARHPEPRVLASSRCSHENSFPTLDICTIDRDTIGIRIIDHVRQAPDPADLARAVILGTVVGEQILAGLRIMAQEHVGRTLPTSADQTGRPAEFERADQ
ncbi:hypothetical protein [Microbacterium gorillae]|uniref:hypothetical protein n=1 Tax=Microbacterium gorillae TaxID=1231063 RepID=UPI000BBE9EC3|nr:hypothetical protein [Microbacterium gorillae]